MPQEALGTELGRVEAWLVAVTTDPDGISAGIARAAALGAAVRDAAEVDRLVTKGPRLSALERLAIYGDGYFARLVECLLDDYPALAHLLGTEQFEALARAYVVAYPSRSPSLNGYGEGVAAFLRSRAEPWAPFAVELAELEWALVTAIHAESRPALAPDALAAVRPEDWARARLVPSPALRVLAFRHPVNPFYQAFRAGNAPVLPAPEPSAVAVHRQGLKLYRHELEPLAARVLAALVRGEPLGVALASLEQGTSKAELEGAQARVSEWFSGWVSAGFFTALEGLDERSSAATRRARARPRVARRRRRSCHARPLRHRARRR
jgi:hypothetical protein